MQARARARFLSLTKGDAKQAEHVKHALGVHGYVLVYSITLKSSFENCKVMREKILDCTGTDWVPIVLVGNKSDLVNQRCAYPSPPFLVLIKHRSF